MKYFIPFLLLAFTFSSCKKKADPQAQAKTDDTIIQKYISDHNLTAKATGSGLYVVIENPGTGVSCNSNSSVRVSYSGTLTDGTVFDSSVPTGITFSLQSVIKGWTEGIPYFKKGGNGILLIPSALGYGTTAQGKIPANSVLIFEIKLIDVI